MDATVVAADDSRRAASTLKSRRLGLVGKLDHLMRSNGVLIPVEQKPSARKLHASHILQVAAQCLLIKEIYTVRPPYGVVALAGGVQERVVLTPALEHRLLATMQEMRELVATGGEPGPRWAERKCQACGFRTVCWP
jgi:CRISPR-associated protein Cas4